jgi:acetyl-CoA C-acetyltransferase
MREVAIAGIGQTPVGEHWDRGLRTLAVDALWAALDDAGLKTADALYVGNMLGGELCGQEHLGALVADYAGLGGIEAARVEAACGSGAATVRQAILAVASGAVEVAIAVGVEKLTELAGNAVTNALATAGDADYEAQMGLSFVGINALVMQRYLHEYGVPKDSLGAFSVSAHANAQHNPNAMFRGLKVTMQDYAEARMIATPINLLDSSPIADGAAAVVVTTTQNARRLTRTPVAVRACELATDAVSLHDREDVLWLKGVERSTRRALQRTGLGHDDIDLFELHDAFSIMAALSLESAGFAERGRGVVLAERGDIARGGRLPVSTMGGLKGRGHPVGATGVYQIVEAATQLRHAAPAPIQVDGARVALAQNIGGSGATVITTVLERMED